MMEKKYMDSEIGIFKRKEVISYEGEIFYFRLMINTCINKKERRTNYEKNNSDFFFNLNSFFCGRDGYTFRQIN